MSRQSTAMDTSNSAKRLIAACVVDAPVPISMKRNAILAFVALTVIVLLVDATLALAETSLEYAKRGQKIWPAFECAVAAERMGDHEAQKRLFEIGYESGKIFLKALAEGEVDQKDARSTVAIVTLLSLQGPSADFMLGRVWGAVAQGYYDKVARECPVCISDDKLMKKDAQTRFRSMNCEFLK